MKLREDNYTLTKLVKNKIISLEKARYLSSLNLIKIPFVKEDDDFEEYIESKDYLDQIVTKTRLSGKDDLSIFLPLHEMVFIIGDLDFFLSLEGRTFGDIKNDLPKCYYGFIKVVSQDTFLIEFTEDGITWISTKRKVDSNGDPTYLALDMVAPIKFSPKQKLQIKTKLTKDFNNSSNGPSFIFSRLVIYSLYNEVLDKYVIRVEEEKIKDLVTEKKLENQINKVAGPRLIYLNRLPTEADKDPENIGTGSPKAAHQRRGTWVTLRAERYKNHPLYQVEKAIYRKPAWIGDRSTIVHGATYTVLESNFLKDIEND